MRATDFCALCEQSPFSPFRLSLNIVFSCFFAVVMPQIIHHLAPWCIPYAIAVSHHCAVSLYLLLRYFLFYSHYPCLSMPFVDFPVLSFLLLCSPLIVSPLFSSHPLSSLFRLLLCSMSSDASGALLCYSSRHFFLSVSCRSCSPVLSTPLLSFLKRFQ